MTPGPALPPGGDDLDARLRRAVREAAGAWMPADGAGARLAMLAVAGRRARRRRRARLAGGSLVVLAAAGALAGGAWSPTGGHAGGARAIAGAPAGTQAGTQAGGRVPAAGGAVAAPTRVSSSPPCVRVAAGSGVGSCAGVLVAVGASGAPAPRAQAAASSPSAAAGPGGHRPAAPVFGPANGSASVGQGSSAGPARREVTPSGVVADVVGRALAVRLPQLPGTVWGEPSVGGAGPTAGAVSGSGAALGSVRVVVVARDPAGGVRSFDLVGTRPGLVQVEVTGRSACASPRRCGTAVWRWTVDVLVSASPGAAAGVAAGAVAGPGAS